MTVWKAVVRVDQKADKKAGSLAVKRAVELVYRRAA